MTETGFAAAFCFKYSPRPGTPAADLADAVPETVKADRLAALLQLIDARREAFNHGCVGRRLPVLIEKPGRRPGQVVGRSPYLQPVHVDGDAALIGRVLDCDIDDLRAHSLFGRIAPGVLPRVRRERACA